MQDYYKILGVARDASNSEIQEAYQAKLDYYRTQYQGDEREMKEKLREVSGAYNMVGDYCERIKYDKVLERMERFEQARKQPAEAAEEPKSGFNMLWVLIGLVGLALAAAISGFISLW